MLKTFRNGTNTMSGLSNYYSFNVSDGSSFFKAVNIFTSRYELAKNYVLLYPKDIDIEVNNVFANTIFEGLNAQVITYSDMSTPIDWSNPKPRPRFVREIDVAGSNVRTAVDRLFQQHHLDAGERSAIEYPIRELEKCLEYHAKLSQNISTAQKSMIESFVEPYLGILKDKMEPWQIKQSLDKACIVVKGYVDPERSFRPVMQNMFINREPFQATSEANPNIPVINKKWDEETQSDVFDSLYMIAKVLTGKANLEGALLQSGATYPNLQTQEEVVMALFQL
jgi:hypothetical protein